MDDMYMDPFCYDSMGTEITSDFEDMNKLIETELKQLDQAIDLEEGKKIFFLRFMVLFHKAGHSFDTSLSFVGRSQQLRQDHDTEAGGRGPRGNI